MPRKEEVDPRQLEDWRLTINTYMRENPHVTLSHLETKIIYVSRGVVSKFLVGSSVPYSRNAQRIAEFVERVKNGQKIRLGDEPGEKYSVKEIEILISLWRGRGLEHITEGQIRDGLGYLTSIRKEK